MARNNGKLLARIDERTEKTQKDIDEIKNSIHNIEKDNDTISPITRYKEKKEFRDSFCFLTLSIVFSTPIERKKSKIKMDIQRYLADHPVKKK